MQVVGVGQALHKFQLEDETGLVVGQGVVVLLGWLLGPCLGFGRRGRRGLHHGGRRSCGCVGWREGRLLAQRHQRVALQAEAIGKGSSVSYGGGGVCNGGKKKQCAEQAEDT